MILENYRYQLSKRLHAFWQNYKLGNQLKTIVKLFMFVIITWIVGSILTILSEFLFDPLPIGERTIPYYLQYFWVVIIELVSGFDVPDTIKLHTISKIISILMLFMNLTLVAFFTAHIVSLFNNVIKRFEFIPEKPLKFRFKKPILICGINDKLKDIIREIRKKCNDREIVVVDEVADKIQKFERNELGTEDVWFVKGNPMDRDVLQQAVGFKDNRVIILSERNHLGVLSDLTAITTALAVEHFYQVAPIDDSEKYLTGIDKEDNFIYTVLEVCNPMNKYHFRKTKINEWICVRDYAMRLLSQAIQNPGIVQVYRNLLGKIEGDRLPNIIEFSSKVIPQELHNKSYLDIKVELFNDKSKYNMEDAIIIGFSKRLAQEEKQILGMELRNTSYFIQINPKAKPSIDSESKDSTYELRDVKKIDIKPFQWEAFDNKSSRSTCYRFSANLDYYQTSVEIGKEKYEYKNVFSRDTILNKDDALIIIRKDEKFTSYSNQIKGKEIVPMQNNDNNKDMNNRDTAINDNKDNENDVNVKKMPGSLEKHVIICNWSKKANLIIEQLRDESIQIQDQKPIVIITDDVQNIKDFEFNRYSNVHPVIGEPADENTLLSANVEQAGTIVVLAKEGDPEIADSQSIIVALAVDKLNPHAHLIIELLKSENEKYVRYSAVDEVICLESLSEKLLAQSALTPGLSRVYMDLLTQSVATNEIYLCDVPEIIYKREKGDEGITYEKLEKIITSLEEDLILIGFSVKVESKLSNGSKKRSVRGDTINERRIIINPSKKYEYAFKDYSTDYVLKEGDKLFIIAFERPNLEELLNDI